jgi:hypothetical protein
MLKFLRLIRQLDVTQALPVGCKKDASRNRRA